MRSLTARAGRRPGRLAFLPMTPAGTAAASAELGMLAGRYWDAYAEAHPIAATSFGDRRFDDRLDDESPAALAAHRDRLAELAERVRAVGDGDLEGRDRVTRSALVAQLATDIDRLDCDLERWTVDPMEGPPVLLLNVESYQPVAFPAQGEAMIERWRDVDRYVETHVANLRRGLADGLVAVRSPVARVVDELDDLLARPDAEWAFLKPLAVTRPDWTAAQRARFADGLAAAVRDAVRPALAGYREVLDAEILPRTRPDDRPGIMHLAGGREAYDKLIRVHTSLDTPPLELHRMGLAEIVRINADTERLGARVFGVADRAATVARLRTDRELYFSTSDEVAAKARDSLARATAAVPRWFGIVPLAPCEVVPMAEHEAKHSTIAYYRQPDAGSGRPGQFFINTTEPQTRPRYEAEVLAFHEAVPGHHLQIAIAQEVADLPDFRKHLGVTAFWEGWGLYTERLSDEMGLYSSDLDRLGMLSMDAWRACRLVVDTGMHALGWTRDQAIGFMRENTALADNNIVNEVDRYIVWPGQALAYKTGQLEMLRLRAESEAALGQRFDIRAFHDLVLHEGAIPLPTLRAIVRDWLAAA